MDINELLKASSAYKASDLHIKVGNPPVLRVDGRLHPMPEKRRVTQEDVMKIGYSVMTDGQKEKFKRSSEIDIAYSVPGLGRFRVNIFQQRGTIGLVFRLIPVKIKTLEELDLPPVLGTLALKPRGLILATGTTGSGKSTTLAAMVHHINQNRTSHILTVEDPIEYLHRDVKSIVNQREVGSDTLSFGAALKSALRQDPDVIMVGEMRDFETVETALVAAETGHLVMSTVHTVDATETINRIISVFPPYQQKQIRMQLAGVLQGIVSMRLVPVSQGKGRAPAVEVLIATNRVKECIIDKDRTAELPDVISSGYTQYGMQSFDQALMMLFKKKRITYEEALRQSTRPDDFALKVKGIDGTSDSWSEMEKMSADASEEDETASGPEDDSAGLKLDRF
ncbi:MAG: PilT/PilU family type 4a pilus ATPase [bacterium]|nr:PilT/PilU family type 4a pilus ATPase [bacterium]MDT8365072.1 PilT/PilU family type 4a pilus ATPase [bacterium]